ncbi:hypothetical protein [Bacillus sp. JJ1562]|uniref:hypothetical protein n=1 Tax=Bacillus sp. JJ1562 TaxID=3122960 RepID=UPI0030019B94
MKKASFAVGNDAEKIDIRSNYLLRFPVLMVYCLDKMMLEQLVFDRMLLFVL